MAGIGYACGFADDSLKPLDRFDLGGGDHLERIPVWINNQRGGYSKRGVKDFEARLGRQRPFASLGPFRLARAPEAEDVDFSQNLPVAGKAERVRYVKFLIYSNHNGAYYQSVCRPPTGAWRA